MIITKTPYRISFFGGGSDYHGWYNNFGGKILSTSIRYYCCITCRYYPAFFDHKSRIVWSKVELVNEASEIQHPVVRAVLNYLEITNGVEISHHGDLPSRSGLGSSSAFTVGILNALYALKQQIKSKKELAQEAIHIERDVLKENVGIQDQIATALGGFNKINIKNNGNFSVEPMLFKQEVFDELKSHLMLFYTGIVRTASDIAASKIKNLSSKEQEIKIMMDMVEHAQAILQAGQEIESFGKLLHEGWLLKKGIADSISNDIINDIYDTALRNGALGGKLLGAGGGGFMLIFAPPKYHHKILEALKSLIYIPFEYDDNGTSLVYYSNEDQYLNK